LTVVVMAVAVGVMVAAAAMQRSQMQAGINRLEARRARLAAEAGIQRAMAALQFVDPQLVSQADEWYDLGRLGADEFVVGDASFQLQVIDASSLVNINTASEEQLQQLPLTQEQIDSLLDWRSEDRTGRPQGATDAFYNGLPNPYNTKFRRLDSVDELLLIRGFNAPLLYEPTQTTPTLGGLQEPVPLYELITTDSFSRNLAPDGEPKLNINAVNAQQMQARGLPVLLAAAIVTRRNTHGTFERLGDVLTVPGVNLDNAAIIIDNFTVSLEERVEGLININTATEATLTTVAAVPADVASAIVARQGAGFASVSELTTVPGVTLQVLQETVDLFTVNSQTFLVRVVGRAGSARVPLEATIVLQEGVPRLLKLVQPPYNDMRELWRWPDETTGEIILGERR
jgi:DNA uptake protein ComE-like DNA-binding protein